MIKEEMYLSVIGLVKLIISKSRSEGARNGVYD